MNVSHMIERLEDAIQVCYDVGKDKNKGYPYATGYAQVIMKETIWQLKELMNEKDRVFD